MNNSKLGRIGIVSLLLLGALIVAMGALVHQPVAHTSDILIGLGVACIPCVLITLYVSYAEEQKAFKHQRENRRLYETR